MMYVVGADLDDEKPDFKAFEGAADAKARFRQILQAIRKGSTLPDSSDRYPYRVALFRADSSSHRAAIHEVRDRRGGTLLIDSDDQGSVETPYGPF